MFSNIKITSDNGVVSQIFIDGQELKNVTSATLWLNGGTVPELTLTVIPETIDIQCIGKVTTTKFELKKVVDNGV